MSPVKVRMFDRQVQVSARVPSDLVDALRRHAEAEDRSFSGELRRAIKAYLQAEGAPHAQAGVCWCGVRHDS